MKPFTAVLTVLSVLVLLAGCGSYDATKKTGEHMELGWAERSVFSNPQYQWFDSSYSAYSPSMELLEDIQTKLDSVEFLVVFGTWCSDSRRELPPFFKIADGLGIPQDHIRLFGVDRSKQYPGGIPQQYEIKSIPTIIVKLREKELGRIVEKPKATLEQDLLEILLPLMH